MSRITREGQERKLIIIPLPLTVGCSSTIGVIAKTLAGAMFLFCTDVCGILLTVIAGGAGTMLPAGAEVGTGFF